MSEYLAATEDEQAILGACILDANALEEVTGVLRTGMFSRPQHDMIFRAILSVARRGNPVDFVSVGDELRAEGNEAKVGGMSYLADLVNGVPTTANARYYANRVRDAWVRRTVRKIGQQVSALAEDGEVATGELLSRTEAAIMAVSQHSDPGALVSLADVIHRRIGEVADAANHPGPRDLLTGFGDLDRKMGGIQGLTILSARPSHGKTQFALQVALYCAQQVRRPVGFFSLEMDPDELADRVMALHAGISTERIRQGRVTPVEIEKLAGLPSATGVMDVWIDPTADPTTLDVLSRSRRLKAQRGLGLVVVDYLQLMGDKPDKTVNSKNDNIAAMSRRLKLASRELRVPFLVLSQMSRKIEERANHVPQLSDLRESGAIEQDADMVIFLSQPARFGIPDRDGEADVYVAKSRNGRTGKTVLAWVDRLGRFADLERKHS